MKNTGTMSIGIKLPIIKEGDCLDKIIVNSVLNSTFIESKYVNIEDPYSKSGWKVEEVKKYDLEDKDVIGITESIVARAQGNYVTVDEIANEIKSKYSNPEHIVVIHPIYSRNRFSMILKAIARAAARKVTVVMPNFDEVGNPARVNPFTGVNIEKYYKELIEKEGKFANIVVDDCYGYMFLDSYETLFIYCGLHDYESHMEYVKSKGHDNYISLADICHDKCEYGLLGSNKATEEKLKLFPNKKLAQKLVKDIQDKIFNKIGKRVEVMVYGDGCFKDPVGGIWEFADPVVSPAYTEGLEGKPNEIKIKAFADDKFKDLKGESLSKAIKEEIKAKDKDLVGNMASQGTTPRRYVDLLGSLMDLTSGSGDKGCPVVLVKNYFKNYADD